MSAVDTEPQDAPLLDVGALHRREAKWLAGYAMRSGETRGRAHDEPASHYRSCYQRDRDRIIHSTAFRRLEYKTQVFVNHEGDHYRTRLTHTLEVAQISRSIARALRLNEDLVEAIALSHDLGHSPFGHAGEEVLNDLMREHGGFNHNVQSLRVVEKLERRYPGFDGLNLSWEVRESIVKHGDHDFGTILEPYDPGTRPLLEAQVADVADSLAYDNHDIDDGVRSLFIQLEDLREVRLWAEAEDHLSAQYGEHLDEGVLVARAISHLIDRQTRDLLKTTMERIESRKIRTVDDVRACPEVLVGFSGEMTALKDEMQSFLREHLYQHYRTLKMSEKAKRFIAQIFCEYQRNPRQLPPSFQALLSPEGEERVICDYIAGMTDRFCQDEYKRLFHPFERV